MSTHMTPERWQQVKALFAAASEREPPERDTFLAEASAGDDDLRREVESLLSSLPHQTDAFERGVAAFFPGLVSGEDGPSEVGRRIGPYQVLREIGYGGMGTVYEAARADDQYHKRVAIKMIKRGRESDLILRRFRHERQILASLDHPNIACLLDGGVTDDGQPYFAMEYVDGQPITEYCDSRQLSVRDRLTLFQTVCSAVQYAHRHLVVHRDLKPSNIFITQDGVVKLLDFGIAKLLRDQDGTDSPALTQAGVHLLTFDYASPEQVRGDPITTATDVYSLGVVLYELLTGERPFRLDGLTPREMARVICEEEPVRPSIAVARASGAQFPQRSAKKLRATLSGELDNIVLMALRKEPARRYASVEQFSTDIRRYLEGRPVTAQPDTPAYRAGKFVRRHKTAVAAAAVLVPTLVGGIFTTSWQARRAEAERVKAEQRYSEGRRLANSLLFEVHDAIADLPGATPVRVTLVQRALEYLDAMSRDVGEDPSLDLDIVLAYQRIGDVQGNPTNANLGDLRGARETYRKALPIAQRVVAARPGDQAARRALALTHQKLADVEAPSGNVAAAVAHSRMALALHQANVGEHPGDAAARHTLAVGHLKLGDLLGHPAFANAGDSTGALAQYREALRLLESQPAPVTAEYQNRRYRALLNERMGGLLRQSGKHHEALAMLQRSLELRGALSAERPVSVDASRDVAITHYLICDVHLALADVESALKSCQRSFAIRKALYEADSRNAQLVRGMGLIHRRLSQVEDRRGRSAQAIGHLRQSVAFYDMLLNAKHGTIADQRDVGHALLELCLMQVRSAAGEGERQNASAACERGRQTLADLQTHGGALTREDERLLERAAAELTVLARKP